MKALVTGAGGGLGSATVEAFRAQGWEVVATDRVDGPWTGVTSDEVVVGEVTSADWAEDVRRTAPHGFDAVVAAHGVEGTGAIGALTPERLEFVMAANFGSVLAVHEATIAGLREAGGAFVAICSQAGLQGEPSSTAYCASKFALRSWMESRHRELAGRVRYRTLCPGATVTPLLKKAFEGWAESEGVSYEDILARRSAAVPVGRLGRPSDIGAAALWLARLRTDGHVIAPVTGGEVMR
jgi:NAD(P)-dependent dehydrogenase (short-subunit alcohol dehydrogenase family)